MQSKEEEKKAITTDKKGPFVDTSSLYTYVSNKFKTFKSQSKHIKITSNDIQRRYGLVAAQ